MISKREAEMTTYTLQYLDRNSKWKNFASYTDHPAWSATPALQWAEEKARQLQAQKMETRILKS